MSCPDEELTFEAAVRELEELVSRLESGELPLEDAIKLYERGVELSRQCSRLLDAAERRLQVLRDAGTETERLDDVPEDGLFAGQSEGSR